MRSVGLAVTFLVVISCSAATTQAADGPPTLPTKAAPNSVASFPCPRSPISTVDIEACEAQQLLRLGRDFNKQVGVLWALLDTLGRRAFIRAHHAWLTYRDQECQARARAFAGGTAAPVTYGHCKTELTAVRVKEIKTTLILYCEGRVRTGPRRRCPH